MIRSSFIFCSLGSWIKSIYFLAIENHFAVSVMSAVLTGSITISQFVISENIFGTTNLVVLLVILTVFINTGFGIAKSVYKQKQLFAEAQKYVYKTPKHVYKTPKHAVLIRKSERFKFNVKKLNFVFFKVLSLMGYLYFAKALLTEGIDDSAPIMIQALNLSTEVLTKVPVAIFWYYEFKSIGENSAEVFGKKASIFRIVEGIFEPRIFKFMGSKTPPDGVNNENDFKDKE